MFQYRMSEVRLMGFKNIRLDRAMNKLVLCLVMMCLRLVLFSKEPTKLDYFVYQLNVANDNFDKLAVGGEVDVFIRQDEVVSAEIRYLEPDRMRYTTVNLNDGLLSINAKKPIDFIFFGIRMNKVFDSRVQIYLCMPKIKLLDFKGNSSVVLLTDVRSDTLNFVADSWVQITTKNIYVDNLIMDLEPRGKSKIGDVKAENAKIKLTGNPNMSIGLINVGNSYDLHVTGKIKMFLGDLQASQLMITASGNAELNIGEMISSNLRIRLRQHGRANISSINALSAKLESNWSNIFDVGIINVENFEADISGSGKLRAGNVSALDTKLKIRGTSFIEFSGLSTDILDLDTRSANSNINFDFIKANKVKIR